MPRAARKSELTSEQAADAQRLKALFVKWQKGPDGLSQEQFAEKFQIGSQGYLTQLLNGYRPLNAKIAARFAAGMQCEVKDFSPTLAAEIADVAAAIRSPIAKRPPQKLYGTDVTQEEVLVGKEWGKVQNPTMKLLLQQLIEMAVAAEKRAEIEAARSGKPKRAATRPAAIVDRP